MEAETRPNHKKELFCISPDSWMAYFAKKNEKKEQFTNICGKPLQTLHSHPHQHLLLESRIDYLSVGVEVGKRLWCRLNT